MDTNLVLTVRAFPFKAEYGGGFGARVHDCMAKQSHPVPGRFDTYEQARDAAKIQAHRMMGDRPYRLCSLKQSRANQNRFYDANIWATQS